MTADNNDLGSVISQNSAPLTDSTAPNRGSMPSAGPGKGQRTAPTGDQSLASATPRPSVNANPVAALAAAGANDEQTAEMKKILSDRDALTKVLQAVPGLNPRAGSEPNSLIIDSDGQQYNLSLGENGEITANKASAPSPKPSAQNDNDKEKKKDEKDDLLMDFKELAKLLLKIIIDIIKVVAAVVGIDSKLVDRAVDGIKNGMKIAMDRMEAAMTNIFGTSGQLPDRLSVTQKDTEMGMSQGATSSIEGVEMQDMRTPSV